MSKRYSGKSFKDASVMKKSKLSLKEKRKLKTNNCNCDICSKIRECVQGYESFETYDSMATRFKNSIKETCDKHNIYL